MHCMFWKSLKQHENPLKQGQKSNFNLNLNSRFYKLKSDLLINKFPGNVIRRRYKGRYSSVFDVILDFRNIGF